MNNFSEKLNEFDQKFLNLEKIDNVFYENLGVNVWQNINTKTKDTKWGWSEEYIRARFVYAMIYSWMFQKEYICVEFGFPKWNGWKNLNPDICVFKWKNWQEEHEKAKQTKNFKWFRENTLAIFEAKKNSKTIDEAVQNQLRSAMAENESDDRIFWVYFDDKPWILIFKKIWNSEIRRFNETKEIHLNGINWYWLDNRDSFFDLPSQKDFIENNESISDLTKLKVDNLDAIDEENFKDVMNLLARANDRIKPKNSTQELIVEFLTLKVFDEKRSKKDKVNNLVFYITDDEEKNVEWKLKLFSERIKNLYKEAEKQYKNVLSKPFFSYASDLKPSDSNDEKFLIEVIKIFQKRAILKSKNESFNQIIFNNFGDTKQKSDNWQFFTPVPIVKAIIKMLNPQKWEEVCDPCAWICDFLAMAFRYSHRFDEDYPDNASHYYGFDLFPSNLKLAELNLVLNWDGWATLKSMDSLKQKLLNSWEVLKDGLFTTQNYNISDWSTITNPDLDLKKYKIIATNPPFWKWRDLKTWKDWKWDLPKETIELYETHKAKTWEDWNLAKSMDTWVLFLENTYKTLEEGWRLAIVLSNSIASIKEWENIRKWFIAKTRIVALVDLPSNTFGETWVATTVIFAYKPTNEEILNGILEKDYEVFVKEIENTGYEVKTVNRAVEMKATYIINEETFETTDEIKEDFSKMFIDFKDFLLRQEEEIKKAFYLDNMD